MTDLTNEELAQLEAEVDAEIAKKGLPTDKDIEDAIKILNETLPSQ